MATFTASQQRAVTRGAFFGTRLPQRVHSVAVRRAPAPRAAGECLP